jgi:hypothetical protein
MAYTVINKPASYFNTVLYTGDDTTSRSITGVGFKPDFTWIKSRSNAYYHELYDAVRGFSSTTNGRVLYSNVTSAEGTPNTFNSFNTDGFTVSKQTGETGTNGTGSTYVAWNWLGANTTVSNTSGTITSTVSANTTAGFSIVRYTGNGTNGATVGHGLGVTPKFIIVKNRGTTGAWQVFAQAASTDMKNKYITLNTTNALSGGVDPSVWSGNNPTSSVFYIGTSGDVNTNSGTYIAYCFADIKGFSKFGSYTGNGSTDGTFVYTGFKPAFLLTKRTDGVDSWVLYDNKRNTFNVEDKYLLPNLSNSEDTFIMYDFVSNGFKLRTTGSQNTSGWNLIYMAFAENPFVSATAIPTTAR